MSPAQKKLSAAVLAMIGAAVVAYLLTARTQPAEWTAKALQPLIVRAFRVLYQAARDDTWLATRWSGHSILKNPMDLWSYQEIIHEVKPDWIIECGTYKGGSALYFAHMLDILGKGRVVTFDVEDYPGKPKHPRIEHFLLSSTSPEAIRVLKERIQSTDAVLVSLDSLHSRDHVYRELELYSPLVSKGSYIVVEDTNINGHPVWPGWGPGPMEAVREFLAGHPEFQPDPHRERFLLTFNPSGYLKRLR